MKNFIETIKDIRFALVVFVFCGGIFLISASIANGSHMLLALPMGMISCLAACFAIRSLKIPFDAADDRRSQEVSDHVRKHIIKEEKENELILPLMRKGMTYKEIATELEKSEFHITMRMKELAIDVSLEQRKYIMAALIAVINFKPILYPLVGYFKKDGILSKKYAFCRVTIMSVVI